MEGSSQSTNLRFPLPKFTKWNDVTVDVYGLAIYSSSPAVAFQVKFLSLADANKAERWCQQQYTHHHVWISVLIWKIRERYGQSFQDLSGSGEGRKRTKDTARMSIVNRASRIKMPLRE
ncbi:hypothetical protein INT44_003163 [Umbelopsis vinacea]|uniref:Uncharacterized protein n=1 Tax=Umbelopsis vinacea TaxID=44442 RepID=A0A8H7UIB2_9FUNG|nr:hypothetical protein INT44_003163 [Umbelopsis vinacea]